MNYRERTAKLQELLHELSKDEAGSEARSETESERLREQVRELCRPSIPDSPSNIRPLAYRALLNLQPASVLTTQYSAFVEEISSRVQSLEPPSHDPARKDSKEDKLLREIERDVDRTFGMLAWFGAPPSRGNDTADPQEDAFWSRIGLLEQAEAASAAVLAQHTTQNPNVPSPTEAVPSLSLLPPAESGEPEGNVTMPVTPTSPKAPQLPLLETNSSSPRPRTRRQALLRPLYIYATLNPGLSYVQGMNSIMAVFWWIFARGGDEFEAEASAFFATGALLSQLRDLYVRSLDGTISPSSPRLAGFGANRSLTPVGLGATLARYTSLLTWLDPNVAASLENKRIDPALYVFRWLTTIFANEFALPDLVRIWDRVMTLFPSVSQADEALSPVLGHLLDLSLAMVLMERQTIVSPFSNFQKITSILQDPQIDGEAVDKLLNSAWDIRDRRLGKGKRASVTPIAANNWRAAASKWSAAATAASTGPTAASLRQRFWAATSSPRQDAHDFELDDGASVADSETSAATAPPIFASRGQRVGFGSEEPIIGTRYRASTLSDIARVDGKVLPPPPEEIDERERSLAHLPPPPSAEDDEDDYGMDEEYEEEGPSLQERAANSWTGLKTSWTRLAASDTAASLSKTTTNLTIAAQHSAASLSQSTARLGSSDAAASLSKATTNLSIQAQLLREQLAEQGPERLAKIKDNVAAATGRFTASTGSEGAGPIRPGSPVAEPFAPPRWGFDSPTIGRRPTSPSPSSLATPDNTSTSSNGAGSNGPKPLLLSGSARRAANGSVDSVSPPSSKRNSIALRSPSLSPSLNRSPVLYTDAPVAPLGIPRSPSISGGHARSSSFTPPTSRLPASSFHSRSASTAPAGSLGLELDEDVPIQSLRLAQPDDDSTIKIRRPIPRARGSEVGDAGPSAVPSSDGRGWSLSDAPVRASTPRDEPTELAFDPSRIMDSQIAYNSPTTPSDYNWNQDDSFAASASTLPLSPVEETNRSSLPPRKSSLSSMDSPNLSESVSSLSGAPQRSKGIRRAPAASKKRSGRGATGSISSLSDITGHSGAASEGATTAAHPPRESSYAGLSHEKRRSVSSFLVGGGDDGDSSSVGSGSLKRSSGRRMARRTSSQTTAEGLSGAPGEWDEATEILNAYGGD